MEISGFDKRVFTFRSFVDSVGGVLAHRQDLAGAVKDGLIEQAFAEKIMLAVTQVNDCRYCRYGHTRAALQAGVSEAELRQILDGHFDGLPEYEVVALTFAQHYAEQGGHPEPVACQRLVDYYGPERARAIVAYIRMITTANLFGNTFDALLSRLSGKPATGSSAVAELAIVGLGIGVPLALAAGVILGIFGIGRRLIRA